MTMATLTGSAGKLRNLVSVRRLDRICNELPYGRTMKKRRTVMEKSKEDKEEHENGKEYNEEENGKKS